MYNELENEKDKRVNDELIEIKLNEIIYYSLCAATVIVFIYCFDFLG